MGNGRGAYFRSSRPSVCLTPDFGHCVTGSAMKTSSPARTTCARPMRPRATRHRRDATTTDAIDEESRTPHDVRAGSGPNHNTPS